MTDTALLTKQFTAFGLRYRSAAVAEFFEHTRNLRQTEIDGLLGKVGAQPLALARDGDGQGWVIGAAKAVQCASGSFEFADREDEGADGALIFVARDRIGEPVDLVAWWPRTDKLGQLFGRVSLLGEQEITRPRLGRPHLKVHATMTGWLRADRTGAVLVNERTAWRVLIGCTVEAENVEHGIRLKAALAAPTVRIVVPETKMRVAA